MAIFAIFGRRGHVEGTEGQRGPVILLRELIAPASGLGGSGEEGVRLSEIDQQMPPLSWSGRPRNRELLVPVVVFRRRRHRYNTHIRGPRTGSSIDSIIHLHGAAAGTAAKAGGAAQAPATQQSAGWILIPILRPGTARTAH